MSMRANVRLNRNSLRYVLAFGVSSLASVPLFAQDSASADDTRTRITISKRTDANVQRDVAAADEYRRKQLANNRSSIVISTQAEADAADKPAASIPPAAEADAAVKPSLPKYDVNKEKEKQPAKSDADATVAPSIGSKTPSNTQSFVPRQIVGTVIDCEGMVFTPVVDLCDIDITPVELDTVPAETQTTTAAKPVVSSNQWSEDKLLEKINEIGNGKLIISAGEPSNPPTTRSSGYRGQSTSTNPAISSDTLRSLGAPVYSRVDIQSYPPLQPINHLVSYAQDEAASAAPTLSDASAVVPAAYQEGTNTIPQGTGASIPPSGGFGNVPPPSYGQGSIPSSSFPSLTTPPSSSTGVPAPITTYPPSATIQPSLPSSSAGPLTTTTPYDAGLSPGFRREQVTTGEPFVTEGPCQFDANFMVAPVSYQTTVPNNCGPLAAGVPQTYAPGVYAPTTTVPGYIAPQTYMPTALGNVYSNAGVAHRPLFQYGPDRTYQVGRGIIGQPVAYIPGQRVRNFFRYFFP